MPMTQMQLIQSLGEAMAWFERELSWGVAATDLPHLCGRIGELYVALTTNGQMALARQRGYDVVTSSGERISVKTTAQTEGHGNFFFNPRTLDQVDRIITLRINSEEMQVEVVLDLPIAAAMQLMGPEINGRQNLPNGGNRRQVRPRAEIAVATEVEFGEYVIRELENGTIEIIQADRPVIPVLPCLRELALELNVGLLNARGNELNTRQLGGRVIRSIQEIQRNAP